MALNGTQFIQKVDKECLKAHYDIYCKDIDFVRSIYSMMYHDMKEEVDRSEDMNIISASETGYEITLSKYLRGDRRSDTAVVTLSLWKR